MNIERGNFEIVTLDWSKITLPLKAGTPVNKDGEIANSSEAIGLIPATITVKPVIPSVYVLVSGDVILSEVNASFGGKLKSEARAAMSGINFFLDDGKIDGASADASASFAVMANQAASSATSVADLKTNFNSLLTALKTAGMMAPDAMSVSALACPSTSAMVADTADNTSHATISISDGVITIALDCAVADLKDSDHGATWGVHKWIGFGVRTGEAAVTDIIFTDDTGASAKLGAGDAAEAAGLGLSAGDFVLYIKAEDPDYLTGDKSFTLKLGAKGATIGMKITETTA